MVKKFIHTLILRIEAEILVLSLTKSASMRRLTKVNDRLEAIIETMESYWGKNKKQ